MTPEAESEWRKECKQADGEIELEMAKERHVNKEKARARLRRFYARKKAIREAATSHTAQTKT